MDADRLESALADLVRLPVVEVDQRHVQALLQTGVLLYLAKREGGEDFGPFTSDDAVPPTAVLVASANMLQAVDIDVFELGMWAASGG